MDGMLVIGALWVLFAGPVLGGMALYRVNAGRRRLDAMEKRIVDLTLDVARLTDPGRRPAQQASELPATAAQPVAPVAATEPHPAVTAPRAASKATADTPRRTPFAATFERLEAALAGRWLVWLGAVAIALAAAFLVKYSIDRDLIAPSVRVAMGFATGMLLVAAGEWLRRRPLHRAIAALRTDHVCTALAASGLFSCFASLYAGYALYAQLPAPLAFIGLALVAFAAIALSLLHGRAVALLGAVGAFATPLLLDIDQPSAWRLFSYLLFVQAACLGVTRYKAWWGLAMATLAAAIAWPLLWIVEAGDPAVAPAVGLYLIASAGLYIAARRHPFLARDRATGRFGWLADLRAAALPDRLGTAAVALLGLVMACQTIDAGYDNTALMLLAVFALLALVAGREAQILDAGAVVIAVGVLLVLASWPLSDAIGPAAPMFRLDGVTIGRQPGVPFLSPSLVPFLAWSGAFAGLFAVAGFAASRHARRPWLWAGISAAMPLAILAIAYWRVTDFAVDPGWSLYALGGAALATLATRMLVPVRHERGMTVALGIYAAAAVAFVALAAAMALREAWLTATLAAMLPALGWIWQQLRVRPLRLIAIAVAMLVLIRLTVNYRLFDYPVDDTLLANWVLYGYGIPALACFVASRLFRRTGRDALTMLLDAAALTFAVLLASLELRLAVEGAIDAPRYGLFEQSLQTIVWLAAGSALAWHDKRSAHPVAAIGSRILLGLALCQLVFGHLLAANPVLTQQPIDGGLLFNGLLLAYLVPAGFAAMLAWLYNAGDKGPQRAIAATMALVLVFAWLTLETRLLFHGPQLLAQHQSVGELYAYSAVWLAFGGALIALGLWRNSTALRHAALAVLAITVIKVFVYDMAGLTGLYRVASFFGLGLSLIAIGYLYQRFSVAAPRERAVSPGSAPRDGP